MLTFSIVALPTAAPAGAAAPTALDPVPFTKVKVADGFWAPRIETNRTSTLPHNIKTCEETGRISNFAIAAGLEKGEFRGIYFDENFAIES